MMSAIIVCCKITNYFRKQKVSIGNNYKIANVFSQMGIVEELGSGMRKMFKYTPLYANGKEPVIEVQDVYRIEIPYVPTLQSTDAESGQKSGPESGPETTQKRIIKLLTYIAQEMKEEQQQSRIRGFHM